MITFVRERLTGQKSIVAAVVAALAALCVWALLSLGSGMHQVQVQFTDADGLVAGNEVRVYGVEVGTVASVQITADRGSGPQAAVATLNIPSSYWPLRQGTLFSVRPKGVLSNVYVELQPGGSGQPTMASNHVFATSETSSPVNLDELSNVFDPSVRSSIQTQLQEGSVILGGGGAQQLSGTLTNAKPLVSNAVPITAVLSDRSPQLDRLNAEFDTISADLAREDSNLRSLIGNADVTLGAIAGREADLQSALVHAAGTLTSLDGGLAGEQHNLAAIFSKGPEALTQARQDVDTLLPLITNVNPHIPSLDVLLHEFVTATGFNAGGIASLRVDGTLPPSKYQAYECGGDPIEQRSVCPANSGGGQP